MPAAKTCIHAHAPPPPRAPSCSGLTGIVSHPVAEQAENYFVNGGGHGVTPTLKKPSPPPVASSSSQPAGVLHVIRKTHSEAKVGIALEDRAGFGTIVQRLTPGGLAEASGLRAGMRVLSVNGASVSNYEQGATLIRATSGGVEVRVAPGGPVAPLVQVLQKQ